MRRSAIASINPVIMICLLLFAGSIVMVSYDGTAISGENEVLNESEIGESAYQAMQTQFYENLGQVQNSEVRFYGEMSGLGVAFTDSSVIYRLSTQVQDSAPKYMLHDIESHVTPESTIVTLSFEGANAVTPYGNGFLSHTSNYFIGNDPDEWYTGIRSFSEVVYPGIYDNIDLIYQVSEEGLKYEFILWPGGNSDDIRILYDGIESLNVDEDGSLVADTFLGPLIDKGLYIYQDTQSGREEVAGTFIMGIEDDCGFGFQIDADYNEGLPLIIDPYLHYSTFVGGSSDDQGRSIALDSSNNVYVTGYTTSSDFPTTSGANDTSYNSGDDVFILKLSSDGSTLLYSTFVGGSSGDNGISIALDNLNNAYITGYTSSSNFPTTPGCNDTSHNLFQDIFILKLSSDGSTLLYSTFVGGSDSDYGSSIALDGSDNAYVTGYTTSSDFPITSGANDTGYNSGGDVIILKLSSDGSTLLYSTFVGGSALDFSYSLALDSSNNAYVTGYTTSSNFPTTSGANDTSHNSGDDVFILKLSSDGSTLLYSTFVGGSSTDAGFSITLDSSNNAYVTGYTTSIDFPTTLGAYDTSPNGVQDVFILKLSSDGSTLLYSTFVGGNNYDFSSSIGLDDSDNAYVAGYTRSLNFPTTPGANDTSHDSGSDEDAFILKLSADGSTLLYSTFIAGSNDDRGLSIVLSITDLVYVTGYTASSDFLTSSGANDTSWNGGKDVFILKLDIRDIDVIIDAPTNTTYTDDFVTVNYSILSYLDYTTQIFFDGVANTTIYPSGSVWSALSDGSHNLTIVVIMNSNDIIQNAVIFSIDNTVPDVDSPIDITYAADSIGNHIQWIIGDWAPGQYKVEGNGSTIGLTSWSENGTISFIIDGLAVGFVYNHTLTVYDVHGNSMSDTVFVKVVNRADLDSPKDLVIELGTIGNQLTWTIGNIWWPLPIYRVDGNATTIDWTACNDNSIRLSIDGLNLGVYNFTISMVDEYGYNSRDTVFVTIVDTTAPDIDSPFGLTYEVGAIGNLITWVTSDLLPESYEVFRNGTSIHSGPWDGTSITIDVDGLVAGTYLYTLIVWDSSGNEASDNVTVFVTPIPGTTTTTTSTTTDTSTSATVTTTGTTVIGDFTMIIIGSIGGGFGLGAVLVLIIFRKRS
ncbi:MAG: hypothetical protein E4H14_03840 [Candidatus Thorarchaeota archaeon]|nr:MAG: hypothetical protein E4H14_03840 [Candidatus Thorarchaeota archaeon]